MTYDRDMASPRAALAALVAEHGGLRVMLAALVAALAPQPRPPDVDALSEHLRRDLGLRPDPLRPEPPRFF